MAHSADYVRAYADRYKDMFPVRLAAVGAIVALAYWKLGWDWSLGFLVPQAAIYFVLWRMIQKLRASPDAPHAEPILIRGTEAITFCLASHNSVFFLAVWQVWPEYHLQLLLLIGGVLMVGALQVHASRLSFAAAVVMPSAAIAWVTVQEAATNAPVQLSVALFIFGVVSAAWRQWRSDRETVELMVAVTERSRELQVALAQAETDRAAAERANQAKSRFLAMISHEVRTPLNVILGLTEVLRGGPRPEAEAAVVTDMADAGGMLLRLLNGALDISKIESGQFDLHLDPVDIGERLDAIARVWRSRVEELGLRLEIERHGAPAHFIVLTDEARVEQVLINYLSNALKLTPNGTIRILARALPAADGRIDLDFEVHDQGPGVPEDQRERIFQPFEQLAAGRAAGGSGLGLALCRASVEALGGALGVRSAPQQGAVFWFRFTAERTSLSLTPPSPAVPVRIASDRAPRILAAEDHPANRKVLTLLLEPFGIDLTLVENGEQAVAAARSQTFDLVLMDVMMPVMDGVAALTAIRSDEAVAGRPHTPIHMLTANVFDDDVARYIAAGADGALKKPIEIAALKSVITDAVSTIA